VSRPVDITARVEADGVSIKLPRLRVEVSRRQAERLRDVLNTVLPPNSEQAARPHLLTIYGDVESELHEYASEAERLEAARSYRRDNDDDGLYRVDVAGPGKVSVDTFTGRELEEPESCTLCNCDAVGKLYGFAVCEYHTDHSEDDAPCPKCYGPLEYWSDANGLRYCDQCMERQPLGATDGLTREAPQPGAEWWCHTCSARLPATAIEEPDEPARGLVAVGDRVRDPLDGGRWREIVRIDLEGTCHMADGGCMSVAECAAAEKRLPSEHLPCPACEAWADGGRILTEEQWTAAVDELCAECGAAGRTKGMHP